MSTIDLVMDLDPLTTTPEDIDKIIAYYRQQRANSEAGIKPKKDQGPKAEINLVSLGIVKPVEPIKRRF